MAKESCSKYRVSQILGVSRQAAYNWFDGANLMSNEKALEAASLLGWNAKVVLAWLLVEANIGSELEPNIRRMAEDLQAELAPELGAEIQQELPLAS